MKKFQAVFLLVESLTGPVCRDVRVVERVSVFRTKDQQLKQDHLMLPPVTAQKYMHFLRWELQIALFPFFSYQKCHLQ